MDEESFGEKHSVIGRSKADTERHGVKGTGFIGKAVMSSGEKPVLGRKILVDMAKPHLALICGKRGSGKSYSLAVMIEELARQSPEIQKRIAAIVIDTVGIFWTLKVKNTQEKKELEEWGIEAEETRARVLVPKGRLAFYEEKQVPVDGAFTIKVSELEIEEFLALFKLNWNDPEGVLLSGVLEKTRERKGSYFDLDDLAKACETDEDTDRNTRKALRNRLLAAKQWGLLEKEGTKIKDLAAPGKVSIIDVSGYRQSTGTESVKDIIVGLIGKKLFEERMLYRKEEEIQFMKGAKKSTELPIVWMLIDEAHMFMPKDESNIALSILLEWIRVGRQPGLSLVLATLRPNKLHPDAISQCDLFISHRMTSQPDIEAVSQLRPSYMHQDFDRYYEEMPKARGYALVLDDNSEKLWMVKVRPRMSWDGGKTASAFSDS